VVILQHCFDGYLKIVGIFSIYLLLWNLWCIVGTVVPMVAW